ncbi:MAG: hypothetical protein A2381_04850 [Bdellovibrionales bacterium RIFOXYB1_FULL_37_110]|nr:MAG: hypothetical protein A2181_01280 [Bdellovibrionales bacterium RIFOXYA1_FULL_38_20]OFZ50513.1 MAG: hypothetical protein A2417_10830 [Bdellovibrionales bacterium RIFOXYC1_FULL_37_79]OFZ60784.1 MAG: hypothetical protein A2381_04850 [Bdellovibrionales bacterium RIFOXYB1_FULL_37_110]OFZ64498.1 MAG: hypothetical protein A2577_08815 [Bdellovibrionales bacterium RIFOXYD1_FULL_36_51]
MLGVNFDTDVLLMNQYYLIMKTRIPWGAILLASSTFITSTIIAVIVNGNPWGTVKIVDLNIYGGISNFHIMNGQWWRFFSSQLVHVKSGHMIFNVVTLFLLSLAVERATNARSLFIIWIMSGAIGTYASICMLTPPWDVGTGASQAIMGIAAAAIVSIRYGHKNPTWLQITLLVSLGGTLLLDLIFHHYPKPGHVVGFIVGYLVALLLVPKQNKTSIDYLY